MYKLASWTFVVLTVVFMSFLWRNAEREAAANQSRYEYAYSLWTWSSSRTNEIQDAAIAAEKKLALVEAEVKSLKDIVGQLPKTAWVVPPDLQTPHERALSDKAKLDSYKRQRASKTYVPLGSPEGQAMLKNHGLPILPSMEPLGPSGGPMR